MKPTEKQKQFIQELRKVMEDNLVFWEESNDIPENIELTDFKTKILSNTISDLYDITKQIK